MGYISDHFLNRDAVQEHLTGLPSLTPVHKALLLLLRCGSNKALREDALQASRSIDVIGSQDPDILAFIFHWGLVASQQGYNEETIACAKLARSLAADASAASPLAFILGDEAMTYIHMKDYSQFLMTGQEALQIARKARPRIQMRVAAILAPQFALLGCLPEMQKDVDQAQRNDPPPDVRDRFLIAELVEATEAFRIDEANEILGQLTEECHAPQHAVSVGYFMQEMLHAYLNMFPGQRPSPLHSAFVPGRIDPDWRKDVEMLCTICASLQNRRPERALKAVYAMHKSHGETFFVTAGIDGYHLIRAELANGNISAAYRALNTRYDVGLRYPVDSFFHARIALLQQGLENAHALFRECLSLMDSLEVRNRLRFELALSSEIPTPVLMEWTHLMNELPASKQPPAKQVRDQDDTPAGEPNIPVESTTSPRLTRPVGTGVTRLVGDSRDIETVRQFIKRMADKDTPILITGHTGTGKEVAAWAIHEESQRNSHPYVAINCAALGESLLSSELFGHERGAFTGASEKYQGLIRAAGKGTLFLDEIGEITPNMQAALLRVLETGEFRPVGSTRILAMRCRIIAATNRDLSLAVQKGRFREDLFYRLRRLEINLSPLRQRKQDIHPLTHFFFNVDRADGEQVQLHADLEAALMGHDWPGNVRELRNTIERIRLFHGDKTEYGLDDLLNVLPNWNNDVPPAQAKGQQAERPVDFPDDTRKAIPNRESERSPLRLEEATLHAFQRYGKMTRKELAKELNISPNTATKYLSRLVASGHIEKVMPTPSPRSHYFQLVKEGC